MKIFITSDTHFYHKNIIHHCDRPWHSEIGSDGHPNPTEEDALQMNNDIIKNWNSVVEPDDIVWHLGDFAMIKKPTSIGKELLRDIVKKLNGRINLVLGNHDNYSYQFYSTEAGFHRVYDRPVVIDQFVILSHAPMTYCKSPLFNIYGHVHDSKSYVTLSTDSCCVCVERWNYTPVLLEDIYKKRGELESNSGKIDSLTSQLNK